jgi:hypothetical protein
MARIGLLNSINGKRADGVHAQIVKVYELIEVERSCDVRHISPTNIMNADPHPLAERPELSRLHARDAAAFALADQANDIAGAVVYRASVAAVHKMLFNFPAERRLNLRSIPWTVPELVLCN